LDSSLGNRLIGKFEAVIIAVLQILLIFVVAAGTIQLVIIFLQRLSGAWSGIDTADDLHAVMQRAFGGVLVVVLGLELIETLKVYFHEHQVRVEVIMIVGMIAVGRHIIQVDYEHIEAGHLAGLGVLLVSLAFGYFIVGKAGKSASHNK